MYYGKQYVSASGIHHGLAFDQPLKDIGFQDGDMITSVGDRTMDRVDPSVLIEEVVLNNAQKAVVIRNGEKMELPLPGDFAQRLTNGSIAKGALFTPRTVFIVDSVASDMPAAKAGLKKGDKTLAVNGRPAVYFDQFSSIAKELKGQGAELTILRGNDTLQTPISFTAQGTIGVFADVQGQIQVEREEYSLADALPGGVKWSWSFLNTQFKAFGQMFQGKIKAQDNLGSIISIGKMFGTTWQWERFWILTGSLSILLAFINLLPIPGLDGGYIFFLIWEMITGRRVSDEFMLKAVNVGFFLLMGLMIYALGLDIWRHYIK